MSLPTTMTAAFIERYGGDEVVNIGPRPRPHAGPKQVLIEVHAASVNPRDWLLREGKYVFRSLVRGFPKILGSDVAGVVVARGDRVGEFALGDRVVAMQTTFGQMGAFAQYMAVDASAVARLPAAVEFADAAGLPVAGLTALQALRDDARVSGDERVAVLGASGGVGHYSVQLAKYFGCEVVAVASGGNHEFVRALGADRCIDYRSEDVVARLLADGGVDIVIDAIGRSSLAMLRPALRGGGRYVSTVPTAANTSDALRTLATHLRGHKAGLVSRTVLCRPRGRDLALLADMLEHGTLRTMIDSRFALAEAGAALARSRSQRARGKIIIDVS